MSEPRIIAGHSMADSIHGLACRDCGRRFVDLASVRKSDIGTKGWSHYGELNSPEFESIQAEIERMWGLLVGVASGRGIGGMAAGDGEMEGVR